MTENLPHPLPLPNGERGRVRGVWILEFGDWVLLGAWNLKQAYHRQESKKRARGLK